MAEKICKKEGCDEMFIAIANGMYCDKHRKVKVIIGDRVCKVDGCNERVIGHGGRFYCDEHRDRYNYHRYHNKRLDRVCKVDGCDELVGFNGKFYCDKHKTSSKDRVKKICKINGCNAEVAFAGKSFCEKHKTRDHKYGAYVVGETWLEDEINKEFIVSIFREGNLNKLLGTPFKRSYLSLKNKLASKRAGESGKKVKMYEVDLWRVCRHYFLLESPICCRCGSRDNLVVDHHEETLDVDSFLHFNNLRVLCESCHTEKSLVYDNLMWISRKLKLLGYKKKHDAIRKVASDILDSFYAKKL